MVLCLIRMRRIPSFHATQPEVVIANALGRPAIYVSKFHLLRYAEGRTLDISMETVATFEITQMLPKSQRFLALCLWSAASLFTQNGMFANNTDICTLYSMPYVMKIARKSTDEKWFALFSKNVEIPCSNR